MNASAELADPRLLGGLLLAEGRKDEAFTTLMQTLTDIEVAGQVTDG